MTWRAAPTEGRRWRVALSRGVEWRVAGMLVAAVAVLAVAGCGGAPHGAGLSAGGSAKATASATGSATGSASSRAGAARWRWMVSAHALDLLRGAGMAGSRMRAVFGDARGYTIEGGRGAPEAVDSGWASAHVATFSSYATMRSVIDGGGLAAGVGAVLYDNEDWAQTPAAEQRDPAHYEQLAGKLAGAHHLALITAPAVDLTRVLAPGGQGSGQGEAAYLRLGLAGDAARYASVVDIQAQSGEASASGYAAFVAAAAKQARAANPGVTVLAGLSTNPNGAHVTADQLVAAVRATGGTVDGYWLNVPAGGTACPRCGTPQPGTAVAMVDALG